MSSNNNNATTHVEEPVKDVKVPEKATETATGIPIQDNRNGAGHYEWSSDDRQQWSTGLCDCFDDIPLCLDVFFCNSCMLSKQYNATMYGKYNTIHWPLCLSIVICDTLTKGNTGIFTRGFPLYFIRKELRDRYHLSNSAGKQDEDGRMIFDEPCDMWTDVAIVMCCTACATCQHHREMTARGEWPGNLLFSSPPSEAVLVAPGSTTAV